VIQTHIPDLEHQAWPRRRELRSWLDLLAHRGELGRVDKEVSAEFELAGVLSQLDGRACVVFEKVEGSGFRAVGNTVLSRRHLALALGCEEGQTARAFARAVASPAACRYAAINQAPVLANQLEGADPLAAIPVPVHHELDAGRYISAGVVIARDPSSDVINLSINRFQIAGGRQLRALLLPGRLRKIFEAAEKRSQPLEVAIAIGVDPLVTLASQAKSARTVDELELCSALGDHPLEVVQAPNIGIPAPANAEFLIEARIRPGERQTEGPFGEFPRTYGPAGAGPVLDVIAVSHRNDPLYQTILSAGREHMLIGAVPRESDLLGKLQALHPEVTGVRLTEGGSCRLHAVFSIARPRPGQAKSALLAALAASPVIKHVVAVDDDVDIFSDEQIEWAVATRVQADSDLTVLSGVAGSSIDPSSKEGVSAKLGVDATVCPQNRDQHARMVIPGADDIDTDALVYPTARGF
jgi:2,5-furandicarboxylate decarboxylase 1